jgi:hypothetical protein
MGVKIYGLGTVHFNLELRFPVFSHLEICNVSSWIDATNGMFTSRSFVQ